MRDHEDGAVGNQIDAWGDVGDHEDGDQEHGDMWETMKNGDMCETREMVIGWRPGIWGCGRMKMGMQETMEMWETRDMGTRTFKISNANKNTL